MRACASIAEPVGPNPLFEILRVHLPWHAADGKRTRE
jgi:hypothetical protein